MTLPAYIISHIVTEEHRHSRIHDTPDPDLPTPRHHRHGYGSILVGTRHWLSAALRSVADRIEPRAAGSHLNSPGAHRA